MEQDDWVVYAAREAGPRTLRISDGSGGPAYDLRWEADGSAAELLDDRGRLLRLAGKFLESREGLPLAHLGRAGVDIWNWKVLDRTFGESYMWGVKSVRGGDVFFRVAPGRKLRVAERRGTEPRRWDLRVRSAEPHATLWLLIAAARANGAWVTDASGGGT